MRQGACPVFAAEDHGPGRDDPDEEPGQEHHDRHYDYGTGHDGLRGSRFCHPYSRIMVRATTASHGRSVVAAGPPPGRFIRAALVWIVSRQVRPGAAGLVCRPDLGNRFVRSTDGHSDNHQDPDGDTGEEE
jgi:hypothetical protein